MFERGSVFRGSLYGADLTDITYGAYGTGAKPVFMGSLANYAGTSYWNSTGVQNVYVCTAALDNVGLIVFDNDINSYNSNALYGIKRSKNSSGFSGYSDLKNDLEFYSDLDNKKLYLYSASGNPGSRFSDIEICDKRNIFVGKANNLRIDNLSMMYTGSHAIGLNNSTNVKVTNCIISWIGGSVLSVDSVTGIETRYGNAIEIYNSCDGFYVDNCWLYQIYDTGITYQQWSGDSACIHKDISFTKNLIEKTHWGIEFINIGQTNGTNVHKVENAYNAYNYIKDTGKGFGSITENRTGMSAAFAGQFVGICNDNDIAAEYNIFDTSVGYLTQIPKNMNVEKYNNNIYIQYNGGGFGWIKGVNIPSDENTKSELVRLVNENGAVVVLTPDM